MRNLIILMVLVSTMAFTACGQKSNVPEKVKTAFAEKFPDAIKISWDKESAKEWETEFKMNGEEYSSNFNSDGTWKETEHEIEKSEIPTTVKQTLDSKFAGYDIEEVEISETADAKVYEFELEKGKNKMEVAISTDGKVVKKEMKKDKDDETDND